MQTTILSSKGQVIIPRTVRIERRWTAGTRLEVEDTPDGVLLKLAASSNKVNLRDGLAAIRKQVAYRGPLVTLEEMDAVVLREAARRNPVPVAPGKKVGKQRSSSPR